MPREPRNFEHLIGKVQGLSEAQLRAHFTLYGGYVTKLNEIEQKLGSADRSKPNYSFNEYSELKRREPVAFNGTFLHELYFENLTAPGGEPGAEFKKVIGGSEFGSHENWLADVKASLASAHGWVITTWSYADGKLRNNLIQSEHHVGLFVGQEVLSAIDAWEHAYFLDYGTKKPDYIAAMFKALDYDVIEKRLAVAQKRAAIK
jgi:Fe-Mn family superoxide dismutase